MLVELGLGMDCRQLVFRQQSAEKRGKFYFQIVLTIIMIQEILPWNRLCSNISLWKSHHGSSLCSVG
jgi:hypothetical protein